MEFVWFILIGLLGGFLGGMGMGGGTIIVPLLTLVIGLSQKSSQAINLISFIPMAVIALFIHKKHHLTHFKMAIPILICGLIGSVTGALVISSTPNKILKTAFGVFLIVLACFSLIKLTFFAKTQEK